MKNWDELKFWDSGEWQVLEERFEEWEKQGRIWNPGRENLFVALDNCPYDSCKVVFMGQDPYPELKFCTGSAFSIPPRLRYWPPTLETIIKEYCDDLHYPRPKNGNLKRWEDQGVLLWNSVPSCDPGKSLSHAHWPEWGFLTSEIVRSLSGKGIVFCFLGGVAREYSKLVDGTKSRCICVSHPSPRASMHARNPFQGSRIFTTINDYLCDLGKQPVEWRL